MVEGKKMTQTKKEKCVSVVALGVFHRAEPRQFYVLSLSF